LGDFANLSATPPACAASRPMTAIVPRRRRPERRRNRR